MRQIFDEKKEIYHALDKDQLRFVFPLHITHIWKYV